MSFKDCWSMVPNALTTANEMAFQNLTEHMFRSLNSHRLKKSIKTKASPFVMERLLQVILRRLEDPENNPPLKIAVFGGSVTEGSQSRTNTLNIIKTTTQQQVCAWAYKLETLLNQIAATLFYKNPDDPDGQQYQQNHQQDKTNKTKIVEVHNFAVSATDSSIGKTLLEYRLFGADMSTMDLIISAFGANDMQSPVGLDRDQIYLDMQGFMRLAKLQRPCNDLPLVLQIDDVFADALRPTVRQGFRYFNEMVETNNWAGFMSLSYADAVRDVLYANPNDEMLHEFGHVHPGVTFHTGMSWIIAYNLLEGLLDACDASSLPEHKNKEPRNGFPLPLLHDELVAQEVSQLWTEHSDKMTQFCAQTNVTRISQCEYKYIAHRLGANTSEMVQQVISSVATNIDGWEGSGFPIRPPKRTWKATRENATFTIQLDHISMPINRMLVLYVKSYGKAWEGTRLSVIVEGKTMSGDGQDDDNDNISKDISSSASGWTELKTLELTGMHDARTSINYSEHIDLGAFLKVGSSVRATFTLVSGGTFQINALALGYFPQPT